MCGIAGAFGVPDASYVVSLMLKAMQHRGQEAAGIVSTDGTRLFERKDFGLVDEVFGATKFARRLPGTAAIGHIRYATTGDTDDGKNIQPLVAHRRRSAKAIVHNGNLTNYAEMRHTLENDGAIFQSSSDTELFLHLMAKSDEETVSGRLRVACSRVQGAYSALVLTPDALTAVVDPLGFRPLSFTPFGDGWLFASETCAFDLFGCDVANKATRIPPRKIIEMRSFEQVYFTRPDSMTFGVSASAVRERLGIALAKVAPTRTDIVTAVPDSSNVMAAAYAEALGIPFRFALLRNHYTGRTFITPKQKARDLGVRMKLNADRHAVEGRTVTVIDDSLVRGTTAKKIVDLLRSAGAREVHLRIASPPVIHPCFWGIDTPNRKELIAAQTDVATLMCLLGADSLAYLPVADLRAALLDPDAHRYCTTCFTGILPDDRLIPLTALFAK